MYHSQNYGAGGFVKAFALNQIVLELTEENGQYERYSRYQQRLQTLLTPEEIDRAVAMSTKWLEAIKENGTLYSR
jgi:hypothetical protein